MADIDTAAIRAEHEALNYRVSRLRNPHDCDGCGAEGAAKWDVLWNSEGRDEEPFLCDACLAREFQLVRLADEVDHLRTRLAAVGAERNMWRRRFWEANGDKYIEHPTVEEGDPHAAVLKTRRISREELREILDLPDGEGDR